MSNPSPARIALGPRGQWRFTPAYLAQCGGPIVGIPAPEKKAEPSPRS